MSVRAREHHEGDDLVANADKRSFNRRQRALCVHDVVELVQIGPGSVRGGRQRVVVGGGENEVAGVQGGRLNPLSPFLHTSPLHECTHSIQVCSILRIIFKLAFEFIDFAKSTTLKLGSFGIKISPPLVLTIEFNINSTLCLNVIKNLVICGCVIVN